MDRKSLQVQGAQDAGPEESMDSSSIHMFEKFNKIYFNDRLTVVKLKWSSKMILCSSVCRYADLDGQCSIHLSKPLLSLRTTQDMLNMLLHEMIHAYLFVVDKIRERNVHGPKFLRLMRRINYISNCHITTDHTFTDEIGYNKKYWWKCSGPCQTRPPSFGVVRRFEKEPPGPADSWFVQHNITCNGQFVNIREPVTKEKVYKGKQKKMRKHHVKMSERTAATDNVEEENSSKVIVPKEQSTPTGPQLEYVKKDVNFYGIVPFAGKGHVLGISTSSHTSPNGQGQDAKSRRPFKGSHPLLDQIEKRNQGLPCDPSIIEPREAVSITKHLAEDCEKKAVKRAATNLVVISSSDEDNEEEKFCPACGTDFGVLTLMEHLQFCDILNYGD